MSGRQTEGEVLRTAASAWLAQGMLHGQLALVDWAEERTRLLSMLLTLLLGFALLFCGLLSVSAMLVIVSWESAYRLLVVCGLSGFFCIGVACCCWRFAGLAARGEQAFAATQAELATDLMLIRKRLEQ